MSSVVIGEIHNQIIRSNKFITVASSIAIRRRLYSDSRKEFIKCYKILNLPENCDQEQLRQAYLTLVKKFHPDIDSSEADASKFHEVENAYRTLLRKMSSERWNHLQSAGEYGLYYTEKKTKDEEEVGEFDIKHTAPQHRQYLSFEGYGAGTPQQRERQYYKYRAMVAAENVYNHRVEKLAQQNEEGLVVKDKKEAKKIKTRYGIDRLVEDLIQESMAKGEFDNLQGKGKPLAYQNRNPYVDFVTHKLNQVLIDNGFMPEWITLQREIGEDKATVLSRISSDRARLGPCPLTITEEGRWKEFLSGHEDTVKEINRKIIKFNLLVPILNKQMFLFDLTKEADRILKEGKTSEGTDVDKKATREGDGKFSKDINMNNSSSFLSLLENIFR